MSSQEHQRIQEEKTALTAEMPKGVALGLTKIDGKLGLAVRIQENLIEGDVTNVRDAVEALLQQKSSSPYGIKVVSPVVAENNEQI